MKKIYLIPALLVVFGITAGISFFIIRDANATIPDDIKLITMNEEVYDFSKSEKKLKLVEFIYTHCPNICPTTTLKMTMLKKDLQKEGVFGKDIEFLTVTIDPYRDTPEVLKEYMGKFDIENDGNWTYITADHATLKEDQQEIQRLADTFQFQYRDPGDGFYVHSSFIYLIDEENEFIKKFPMGEDFDPDEAFERIMKELK